MNDPGRAHGPVSATELMAQLAQDEDHQQRMREQEAARAAVRQQLRDTEAPIVRDLSAAGVTVTDSVWDLIGAAEPDPAAIPVLLDHLERGGYPEPVMESLGRALAVGPALDHWARIESVFLGSEADSGQEIASAIALSRIATKRQSERLIDYLTMENHGVTRVLFIRPVLRLARADGRGRQAVEALRDHPVLGVEASARLASGDAGRRRRQARRVVAGSD